MSKTTLYSYINIMYEVVVVASNDICIYGIYPYSIRVSTPGGKCSTIRVGLRASMCARLYERGRDIRKEERERRIYET